ncbi:MAG TPA: SpoIIE family protein phosphatase [Thermoanaerobaculia bacterium]|jgi:serine phosphatase RsbU (regulator of sigma subunit)|nr:SpoIIE family protein phosphatase [Thermoanaerobaculia bacterium]
MSSRRRLLIGLTLVAVAMAGVSVFCLYRLNFWHQRGWAGFNYMAPYLDAKETPSKTPRPLLIPPGRVLVTLPGEPAAKAGLRMGDQIVSVNGVPIEDQNRLRAIDARTKAGDVLHYIVRRDGRQRAIDVQLRSPMENHRKVAGGVATVIVVLAFLGIGIFVFLRSPDDRRVVVFFAMCSVGAFSMLTSGIASMEASNLRGIVSDPPGGLFAIAVLSVVGIAFLPLIVHLSLVFPKDRPVVVKHPYVIRWVYALPIFTLLLTVAFLTLATVIRGGSTAYDAGYLVGRFFFIGGCVIAIAAGLIALRIAYKARSEGTKLAFFRRPLQTLFVFLGFCCGVALVSRALGYSKVGPLTMLAGAGLQGLAVLLYPLFACIELFRSYRDANVEEKRQVRWPLWGTIIALVARAVGTTVGFTLGVYLTMRGIDIGPWMSFIGLLEIVPRLLYLLIPLSFAFAILKYRLMNIDVIIKKTVVYAILSGAVILCYLVLVGGLGTLLVRMTGVKSQTMVITSTLVVALAFVPLRNSLQKLVDRNLFREAVDYPQALRTIGTLTLTATDIATFVAGVSEAIQQALQNRAVVVFLRRNDELVATAKVGMSDAVVGRLRVAATPAFTDLLDRPFDPRKRALPDDAAAAIKPVEASLIVPIRGHGFIALARKLSDQEYDLNDIEFLSSAADQIAIAAERIRLQRDELDFEHAREIQEALLPRTIPQLAGYQIAGMWEPARMVGGDYFDVLSLGPSTIAISIGDVVGKGMPAALLMSALQAAVRASATAETRAADLCERVRRVVAGSLTGGKFITFFYAALDGPSRRLRWCNAGHNLPLLVRADGRVERLAEGGPVISRVFRDPYAEGETVLEAGDRVVLFTDGASEARGGPAQTDEQFGEDRLAELVVANRELSAQGLQAVLVEAISTFSAGELEDDLTLVVLSVEP